MTTVDETFIKKLVNKDRRIVARSISMVEQGGNPRNAIFSAIQSQLGKAHRVGITGPPGAGKSTITASLIHAFRRQGLSIGIIVVDPTSPFTHGAILGDRIRMTSVDLDEDVFIRSMATRGNSGGLSAATHDAMDVLDAAGFNILLLESVGVGQVDLDIEKFVDTTVVVLVPESGDQMQAIKAGLMEIADIYILNKSDRPDSDAAYEAIHCGINHHKQSNAEWIPALIKTIASEGVGIERVVTEIEKHWKFLVQSEELVNRRLAGMKARIMGQVNRKVLELLWTEARIGKLTKSLSDDPVRCQELIDDFIDSFLNENPEKSE